MATTNQTDTNHNDEYGLEQPWRHEVVLRYFYYNCSMTMAEVADEVGCTQNTISNWMDKYDLPPRGGCGHEDQFFDERGIHVHTDPIDPDLLYELHHENGMDRYEIADEIDRSVNSVRRYITMYEIPPP